MNFRPLRDNVLVARDEWTHTESGLLHVPSDAKMSGRGFRMEGTVRAVGPGRFLKNGERAPVGVAAGDRVIFPSWASHEVVELDGEKLYLMSGADLAAVRS